MNMMWALSDIKSWVEWECPGKPGEAPEALRRLSPLTYAARVKTPTLVLQGDADTSDPLGQSQELYRGLRGMAWSQTSSSILGSRMASRNSSTCWIG